MQKKLFIEGMSCGHCVSHLQAALTEDIAGVEVVEINLEGKYAVVKMDMNVSEEELRGVIEELGYELKSVE